jgi:hypothetical protein
MAYNMKTANRYVEVTGIYAREFFLFTRDEKKSREMKKISHAIFSFLCIKTYNTQLLITSFIEL